MHAWNLKYFYSTKGIKLAKCNLTSWEDTMHQMKMLICFSALWKLFFNMYVWHVMYLAMMKDYLFSVLCEATSFICQTFYRTCVCSVPTAFWPTTMIKMLIFSRAPQNLLGPEGRDVADSFDKRFPSPSDRID